LTTITRDYNLSLESAILISLEDLDTLLIDLVFGKHLLIDNKKTTTTRLWIRWDIDKTYWQHYSFCFT